MVMRLCLAICWADRASMTGSWALIGDIVLMPGAKRGDVHATNYAAS